jgi:hypothetical protein
MNARLLRLCLCCCAILALAAPAHAGLLISEVVYNEAGSDTTGEWIEIYNPGPNAIDLTNYKIGDEEDDLPPLPAESGGMWQFPAGASIPAYGVQVIAVSGTKFTSLYPAAPLPTYEVNSTMPGVPDMINYLTWSPTGTAINMANAGDQVLLLDGTDAIVDMISWGNTTFAFNPALPTSADGQGQQRIVPSIDTNSAADWQVSNPVTPGSVPAPEPTSLVLAGLTVGLAAALRTRRRDG